MADEVQTFKALITIHKVLQEGHPVTVKEAQQNVSWIESLARGVNGEGLRGKSRIPHRITFTATRTRPWSEEF
jgi:huntingtin-interacting protein 1-related protein